jgi:uncharacterized protein (TIGR03435 family)
LGRISFVLLLAACAAAQPVKFDSASVKHADQCAYDTDMNPGMVSAKGVPLRPVMITAFHMRGDLIEGPGWLDSDCFDIVAKMAQPATPDQMSAALLALLVDRFGLTYHKETRQQKGYSLVVDKDGPKSLVDDPAKDFMQGRGTVMLRRGGGGIKRVMTMAQLASFLSGQGYGPVEDHTGLTAQYDIDLSWAKDQAVDPANATAPPAPTADLFTAVREQLGLRLDHHDVAVEYIVIDHIERVPTGN